MKLKQLVNVALPVMGLTLATAALDTQAATPREARTLIGVNVDDTAGRRIGTIRNVELDRSGDQATFIIDTATGTEVLRVPVDAALAARRGNTLMLIRGSSVGASYGVPSTVYVAAPTTRWNPSVTFSNDRRLNRLIGAPVEDLNGASIGEVERVALVDTAEGEKAFAVVEPTYGNRPLVVPLGHTDTVISSITAARPYDAPLEVVVNREDGTGYIPMPVR